MLCKYLYQSRINLSVDLNVWDRVAIQIKCFTHWVVKSCKITVTFLKIAFLN